MNKSKIAYFYAAVTVFLWSTVATAFKFTLEGMNYIQLVFYSSLVSTIVLFITSAVIFKIDIKSIITTENLFWNIFTGFLNPFLYYLVLFKAYSILPAQEAQPLNYTWPIVISILSVIFLKNKFSAITFAGLLIAFSGVIIIAVRGDFNNLHFENPLGVFLSIGSSIIWASYWIINLRIKNEPVIVLLRSFIAGTIFSFLFLLSTDSLALNEPDYIWGAIYIGFFEMGITFLLWMKALQFSADKTKISALAYLSPFLSLMFIAIVLGEKIKMYSVIGLIFIVCGILIQNIRSSKRIQ